MYHYWQTHTLSAELKMRIDENGHFDNNNYKISPNLGLITRESKRILTIIDYKIALLKLNGQILSSNTTSSDDIVCVCVFLLPRNQLFA